MQFAHLFKGGYNIILILIINIALTLLKNGNIYDPSPVTTNLTATNLHVHTIAATVAVTLEGAHVSSTPSEPHMEETRSSNTKQSKSKASNRKSKGNENAKKDPTFLKHKLIQRLS